MPTFDFTAPDGTNHSIDGPEGATREQAFHVLQLKLGGQPAPAAAAPQESLGSDVAKSVGSGLEQGTATALGFPGDVASLAHAVAPQSAIDAVKAVPGAKWLYNHLPGSQAVLDSASDPLVDPNYQPQSAAGRYSQAIAKNAGPGLASGMGALPTIAGAVTGQVAYDATGSHLAEAGGNLLASIASPLALARITSKALTPLKDASALTTGAKAVYNGPELSSALVSPQSLKDLALNTDQTVARRQFDPDAIGEVRRVVDRWHATDQPQSIADLQNSRARLNELATGAPTTQTAAAGVVKDHLDDYLRNLQPHQIVAGDAQGAARLLKNANADYRFGNSADRIGDIIQKAADTAGTQGSGLNGGNLQRKGLLPLLDKGAAKLKQMGMGSPDEIDAVRTATQGDAGTNIARHASNMFGGGGGIGSALIGHTLATAGMGGTAGAAEGYHEGGFGGGLTGLIAGTALGAAPGITLRLLANARTRKSAQAIQDAILSKAPANAGIVARNSAATAANAAAYSNAAGRNGIPNGLLQALMMHKYASGN